MSLLAPGFPPPPHPSFTPSNGTTPLGLDITSTTSNILRLTENEREKLRCKGACFRCCRMGHMSRDCLLCNHHSPVSTCNIEANEENKETNHELLGKGSSP